jgi:hypothetical protein
MRFSSASITTQPQLAVVDQQALALAQHAEQFGVGQADARFVARRRIAVEREVARMADHRLAIPELADPQLRPLQVAEDRNRAAKALLDRADRGDGFGMSGVVAVAHVDAEGVGAGAQQLFDHFRAAAGGAEGGKDLYLAAAWIKSGQCVPLSFAHRPMAKQGQTQGYPR